MKKLLFFWVVLLLAGYTAYGQQTITGVVTNAETSSMISPRISGVAFCWATNSTTTPVSTTPLTGRTSPPPAGMIWTTPRYKTLNTTIISAGPSVFLEKLRWNGWICFSLQVPAGMTSSPRCPLTIGASSTPPLAWGLYSPSWVH